MWDCKKVAVDSKVERVKRKRVMKLRRAHMEMVEKRWVELEQ